MVETVVKVEGAELQGVLILRKFGNPVMGIYFDVVFTFLIGTIGINGSGLRIRFIFYLN